MKTPIRPGDTVVHKPTGETWVIAAVNRDEVMPCGWPESIAKAADCEVVHAANDEEMNKMVDSWASKFTGDLRSVWCGNMKGGAS